MNEKYDGGYFIGSPEGRKIMRERSLEHYGTEYIWQAEEIKMKRSETMLKNHGVEHTYIPDFHITDTDKLIEIKGDHFFDSDGNFIDPYDKSEEGAANAKLKWKCMMDAGVIVLTSKELLELGINLRK